MKHIIESQQFDRKTIERIFALANSTGLFTALPLKGKIMASLFYEPSTRTRFSFESAMLRLGGEVISTENAADFSSVAKGETLEDTIRVVHHYADVIVLRHPEMGAAARAATVSQVPLINAGDGIGQHPTQALLDLFTIQQELKRVDDIHIVFIGDLKHGRTVRSLSYLLGKYKKILITFVSPPPLRVGNDIQEYLTRHRVKWYERADLDGVLQDADVVYQTRIQKERFENLAEYKSFKGKNILTLKEVMQMRKGSIIMHPLPRVDEIATEVDDSPHAAYFRQAQYGLWVRMALLKFLLA